MEAYTVFRDIAIILIAAKAFGILARKVKAWIKSSMDEVFDSMARTNPRLREV